MNNKETFDYHGITEYHKNNITGKGQKWLVIDRDFNISKTPLDGKIKPIMWYGHTDYYNGDKVNHHGMHSCETLLKVAPDVEIYFAGYSEETLEYALKMDIKYITMSMSIYGFSPRAMELSKQLVENGCLLLTSAGNLSNQGVTLPAWLPEWIAVGACIMVGGKPIRAPYSSIGEQMEVCTISGLDMDDGSRFYGTSCSTPLLAGMTALYVQYSQDQEVRKHYHEQCLDIDEEGKDVNTGYGMYILPVSEPLSDNDVKYRLIKQFVSNGYYCTLNRKPDAEGLEWWTERILNEEIQPIHFIEHVLLGSLEFTTKDTSNYEFIEICYKVFFDRLYDQGGMDYWLGQLNIKSREWLIDQFKRSDEWKQTLEYYMG